MIKRIAEYLKNNQKEIVMALYSFNPNMNSAQVFSILENYTENRD